MRSFFTFARAMPPARFEFVAVPGGKLLAINEIWDESLRHGGSLLVLRVRSDSSPQSTIGPNDSIEWIMGLIDATTRWRCSANMMRVSLQAVKTPLLARACWQGFSLVTSKHQAALTVDERQGAAQAIQGAIAEAEKNPSRQVIFEIEIAKSLMHYCFADNEHEAISLLPNMNMFGSNLMPGDAPEAKIRTGSVITLMSSLLLSEAFVRLCERMPDWLYAPIPSLSRPATASSAGALQEPEVEGGEDEDDED